MEAKKQVQKSEPKNGMENGSTLTPAQIIANQKLEIEKLSAIVEEYDRKAEEKRAYLSAEKLFVEKSKKLVLATSSNFIAKRLTAIPQRMVSFDKLTQKQKIDYFTDCALKGVLPNVTGEVVLNVKGLYSIDYFKAFTAMVRTYSDKELLAFYGEIFTKRDATSTESRVIRQYLETGVVVYPNLADKTAVIVSEEEEQEEGEEGAAE